MNIYRHTFTAACPSDGDTIVYNLEIRTLNVTMVEHIKTAKALIRSGYHEHRGERRQHQSIRDGRATHCRAARQCHRGSHRASNSSSIWQRETQTDTAL
jgi:hypothetical protein